MFQFRRQSLNIFGKRRAAADQQTPAPVAPAPAVATISDLAVKAHNDDQVEVESKSSTLNESVDSLDKLPSYESFRQKRKHDKNEEEA